ncbi:MAG: vWA domain-containing protein [Patescibacteria group bacterium]
MEGIQEPKIASTTTSVEVEEFLQKHNQTIEDYAMDTGLLFRPDPSIPTWMTDFNKGIIHYSPSVFCERGYDDPTILFAICHEIEHFSDWRKYTEAYNSIMQRSKGKHRYRLLYNSLTDIRVNRRVEERSPGLYKNQVPQSLYEVDLFPGTDYTTEVLRDDNGDEVGERPYPKHLQFITAMLREAMVSQRVQISDDVREEIERLRNFQINGSAFNFIEYLTDPSMDMKKFFMLTKRFIEPIYERLYREDLDERKESKKGSPSEGNPFDEEYKDMDKRSIEAVEIDDLEDEIKKMIEKIKTEAESPETKAKKQFEEEHDVDAREVEKYTEGYRKIKQYIESLSEVFSRIISKHTGVRRFLNERTSNGIILNPSEIVQAYIDANSMVMDSPTQLKMRKIEFETERESHIQITLVCDLSESMTPERREEQLLSAILILEALEELENEKKAKGIKNIKIETEVRAFGSTDMEVKPLSSATSTYKEKVGVSNVLRETTLGGTLESESLFQVLKSLNEKDIAKIKQGDLTKIVFVVTDGGSNEPGLTKQWKAKLQKAGVILKAIQIGEVCDEEKGIFNNIWGIKDGIHCTDVSLLVSVISELLKNYLS